MASLISTDAEPTTESLESYSLITNYSSQSASLQRSPDHYEQYSPEELYASLGITQVHNSHTASEPNHLTNIRPQSGVNQQNSNIDQLCNTHDEHSDMQSRQIPTSIAQAEDNGAALRQSQISTSTCHDMNSLDEKALDSLDEKALDSLDSLDEKALDSLDEKALDSLDKKALESLDEKVFDSLNRKPSDSLSKKASDSLNKNKSTDIGPDDNPTNRVRPDIKKIVIDGGGSSFTTQTSRDTIGTPSSAESYDYDFFKHSVISEGIEIQDLPAGVKINIKDKGRILQYGNNNTMHVIKNKDSSTTVKNDVNRKTETITIKKRPVTTEDCDIIAKYLGKDWRQLGAKLGFVSGELDAFEHDFTLSGLHEIIYQMMLTWRERNGKSDNLRIIGQKLLDIKRPDVVKMLSVNGHSN